MDLATPLRLGTGGYTMVPNWLIDGLAAQGSDAVALGVLLTRLIPGQEASIALADETSRAALAKALGWGTRNWRRFQAAMEGVIAAGGASYAVMNGNTPVVTVTAGPTRPAGIEARPAARMAEGEGAAKSANPPHAKPAEPVGDHTRTRLHNFKKEKKKTKLTPLSVSEETRGGIDFSPLLELFAWTFACRPSPRERRAFTDAATETGATIQELKATISRYARNPYLAASTTSPMRLLHATAAEHAAARVDTAVRRQLRLLAAEYDRRGDLPPGLLDKMRNDLAHAVAVQHEAGGGGRLSEEVFLALFDSHYAKELEPLICPPAVQDVTNFDELGSCPNLDAETDSAASPVEDLPDPIPADQDEMPGDRRLRAVEPAKRPGRSGSSFADLRQMIQQFGATCRPPGGHPQIVA